MTGAILRKSLYDQRHSLIWWSLGTAGIVLLMALLWPSIRDVYSDELMRGYPEAFREAFNIELVMTGAGYLNVEVFSIIVPIVFVVFAVGRGAGMIAGEEQAGTLEPIVVLPVPRWRILVEKALALVIGLVVLAAVTAVSVVIGSALGDLQIALAHAVVGAAAMALLGLYAGFLALGVGAATGRRGAAMAASGLVLVFGYLLHIVGAILDWLGPWRVLSPFTQAIDEGPISGVVPWGFGILALTAVVFLAIAVPLFGRRDIHSG